MCVRERERERKGQMSHCAPGREEGEIERESVCVCKRERERGGCQGDEDEAHCAPGRGQRERERRCV